MKKLQINILRGKNKVGENLIEITDGKTKILLECGVALEPTHKSKEIEEKVLGIEYDAIIITHCHADHSALLKNPLRAKTIYLGQATFQILNYCNAILEENKCKIKFIESEKSFFVGDIECKPYLCDHSAFDSYMVEIKKDGENVLYTGDFRSNGRKNFDVLISKLPEKVNVLIVEGTNLVDENQTEKTLEKQAAELFAKHDKVFVLQSALNVDRTVSFYRASKKTKKPFIMGQSLANICAGLKNIPNPLTFGDCFTYFNKSFDGEQYEKSKSVYKSKLLGRSQIAKLKKFTMQIDSGMIKYLKKLNQISGLQDCVLVYSMWQGYKPKMQEFLKEIKEMGIKTVDLHVSGHADCKAIKKLIEKVNPDKIEFVHTEKDCWHLMEKSLHRMRVLEQKLIIIDVETNKPDVEDRKKPAKILRIDATKLENGKIGETFSSLVACGEYLNKKTVGVTGINNDMLKGAPKIKQVLKKLKEFTNGYDIYCNNDEFCNTILSYYSKKTGEKINLAKTQYYDRTSMFLHSKCGIGFYLEFLNSGYEYETVYLAEQLLKFINGEF